MRLKQMATIICIAYGIMAIMPMIVGDVPFIMNILVMCLIWAVVASCWDVMMGFAGIFSFGQVAFFVMGAYCSGILSIHHAVPPVFSILIAGIFTAGMGVLVGLPCLKLAGPYVALVTFGVHMALEPVVKGEIGIALGSGGHVGLLTIPPINLFGYTFSSANLVPTFYLTLVVSFICAIIIMLVIKSYWGTAFLALKDSQDFSMSLGISAFKYKLMVFALTSFLTGVIGAFYGHFYGVLSFRMLSMSLFTTLMVMMLVGGLGQFPGVIIGSFLVVIGSELMNPLGAYRDVIIGALAVVMVMTLPKGIMGVFRRRSGTKSLDESITSIKPTGGVS